jgi:diaminopimelate epimerase
MKFVKMHGAGNDYVVIDAWEEAVPRPGALARRMCHRRFGVGADGLILLLPPAKRKAGGTGQADLRMRMFNPDGSEAEMCGNGIRCLGKLACDLGRVRTREFRVETKAGVRLLRLLRARGRTAWLEVTMGKPVLERAAIPVARGEGPCLGERLRVAGWDLAVHCLSVGNPHCVIFLRDLGWERPLAEFPVGDVGPQVERHPFFPQRTNVEFVEVASPARIRLRTCERGAGETLACGTGAVAAAAAGMLRGWLKRKVVVEVLGGRLQVRWPEGREAFLTGPAETVFRGEWLGG